MTDAHSAQHSSASPVYGTPGVIAYIAHVVLGRIDLDPFSDDRWNETIRAARFLTAADDAFTCAWFDGAPTALEILRVHETQWRTDQRPRQPHTALVNPPGDKRGEMVKNAWRLVEWHHRTGWLAGGAIVVLFNIGQLQTLQGLHDGSGSCVRSPLHRDFLRCVPRRRVRYESAPGVVAEAPAHASALVLLPAPGAVGDMQRALFNGIAGEIGEVF
jgi:hypothetical protein